MFSYMVQFQERGITSVSSIGKNMDFGACHSWFKSNALKSFTTWRELLLRLSEPQHSPL